MAASVRIRFSSTAPARISCIRASSFSRYSATVWGLRASTWETRSRMVLPLARRSASNAAPSAVRMALNCARAFSAAASSAAACASSSFSGSARVNTSGSRARVDTAISSRTPYSRTSSPMARRYPSTTGRLSCTVASVPAGWAMVKNTSTLPRATDALTRCLMGSSA